MNKLDVLKDIKVNSKYQFDHSYILKSLPGRNNEIRTNQESKEIQNMWYDKQGFTYTFLNNYLIIKSNKCFFDEDIITYINSIPSNLGITIVLELESFKNETAGINMLFDILSRNKTTNKIIIPIGNLVFSSNCALDFENLPANVKVSNTFSINKGKDKFNGENCFDWWFLKRDEDKFNLLLSKLSNESMVRAKKLRTIANNFYRFIPNSIREGDAKTKSDFVYDWCRKNIFYDNSATLEDGSLNYDRVSSQDPIITFEERKGVCAGRARLFKVLLNNYYMQINCFLVRGLAGRLEHEWNEVIDENKKSIHYDISKENNLHRITHADLELNYSDVDEKDSTNNTLPLPKRIN